MAKNIRPRLLAISGSTRHQSTNTALLKAISASCQDIADIEVFAALNTLPIFSPDEEGERTPEQVINLCLKVEAADGLIFAVPEYAHGIPGGLKNALDWMVSRTEFPDKPLLMVHASDRGVFVRAALSEVLRTMSGRLMSEDGLTIHLIGKPPQTVGSILQSSGNVEAMRTALIAFVAAIKALEGSELL